MKADIRRNWEYRGCKVNRVDCQHPTWGKCCEPIRFRIAYRNRYWRINFPDKTWVHVEFKADARSYIDDWHKRLDSGKTGGILEAKAQH